MKVLEAKDFVVQQTAEQATLENVPLSDLEKRMMYFTEGAGALEDPATLNEEFEAQYDTTEYEKKISRLMHHAYKRVRTEAGANLQTWNEAIRRLKRGDHYVMVMWGQRPGIHPPELIGLGFGVLLLGILYGLRWMTHVLPPPNPQWMLAVFLAAVLGCLVFRRAVSNAFGWILDNTVGRLIGGKDDE